MPFFATFVNTPGLSFSATVMNEVAVVVLTDCPEYPELVSTFLIFDRKKDGFYPDGMLQAGSGDLDADRLNSVIELVQIGLATLFSLQGRIPTRSLANVTNLGFPPPLDWGDCQDALDALQEETAATMRTATEARPTPPA